MGDKDLISKSLFKLLVRDFAIYLFDLPVTEVELLDGEQQRIEERRADLLAKVRLAEGPPFLLHIEIQNDNQALMPARMMRYLSDSLLAYPGLPVRQYLVYIGKKPLTMADGLDLPQFTYRYGLIDMHTVDCQALLRQDSPDAWVLAILCDFKDAAPRDIVHGILARLQERFGENPPRLREYVDMLDTLASNRDLNLDIREELDMLAFDMEKLATYQMGLDKGREKGREEGREEGAHERSVAIARNLLAMGLGISQVVAATGLPLAEAEALREGKPN